MNPGSHTMGIRPSRTEDQPALVALWERSVRATHRFLTGDDILNLRPLVALELAKPTVSWWVLEADSGAAWLSRLRERWY